MELRSSGSQLSGQTSASRLRAGSSLGMMSAEMLLPLPVSRSQAAGTTADSDPSSVIQDGRASPARTTSGPSAAHMLPSFCSGRNRPGTDLGALQQPGMRPGSVHANNGSISLAMPAVMAMRRRLLVSESGPSSPMHRHDSGADGGLLGDGPSGASDATASMIQVRWGTA